MPVILVIILLGIVEGVTEFIPVSSTGHLILASELLGYDAAQWSVFNVVIQLGAILAVIVLYWRTFWAVLVGLIGNKPESWRFVRNVLVAFIPSAVLGFIFIDRIEALLESAKVVAWALLIGGIAMLVIEKTAPQGTEKGVADISLGKAIGVGLIQCLSMIPGVSRSGATILGGLSLGIERRTAAEFSFFLAIPTMLGASVLDLAKHGAALTPADALAIAVGFITAFVTGIVFVKFLIRFVARHTLRVFAWYRIALGFSILLAFAAFSSR
jgi:undecaprenyl-diphosphatase